MRQILLAGCVLLLVSCARQTKEQAPRAKAFGTALVEVGGSKQIASIGTVLDQPVVVQVNDAKGAAAAGALVQVHVDRNGEADPPSGLTGPDGQFTTMVRLGGTAGPYKVVASTRDQSGKAIELRLDEVALGFEETHGQQLADLYCGRCHNSESSAERVSNHDNLTHNAHAFSEGAVLNALSEADLTSVIAHGGPALNRSPEMPPFGYTLKKPDVAAMIAYIRAVADPPFRPKGAAYGKN
jgi:mono/diheme cytochrome c family protein